MHAPDAVVSVRPRRWIAFAIWLGVIAGVAAVATVVTDAMSEEGCGGG